MRNLIYSLVCVVCLSACGGSSVSEVKITGEIKGLKNDTIYMYGNDELSDLRDTIYVHEGKLSHTLPLDTLIHVVLVLDNETEYPLYLEKNKKITIKGDLSQSNILDIKGVAPNEELVSFYQSIVELSDTAVANRASDFIKLHQTSLASVHLLDKYFVQQREPDIARIKELISYMDGSLQDKPYVEHLSKLLEQVEKAEVGKSALSFTLTNIKGERINRSKYRGKYLLINFWASWNDSCKVANKELREIYDTYYVKEEARINKKSKAKPKEKKEELKFDMLGISLDIDKNSWREAIKTDSLNWEQGCDFTGWRNSMVVDYNIYSIPYNLLLGTDGRILARDIKGEALKEKLNELLKMNEKK